MTRNLMKSLVVAAGALVLGKGAFGQAFTDPVWDQVCKPPTLTTSQYSDDYNTFLLENDLFGCAVGVSGTVNYGGCAPSGSFSENVRGRIGFTIGSMGSIQDQLDDQGNIVLPNSGIDNEMRLTPGMPKSPGATFGYAMIVQPDGTRSSFGSADITTYFIGASNRYMFLESTASGCVVRLQVDLMGDGARLAWTLQSTSATAVKRGLWFGQFVDMLLQDYSLFPAAYVTVPGRLPLLTDIMFDNTADPNGFPNYTRFGMTQERPYGLEIENGPNATTTDSTGVNSDQTQAEQLLIGKNYLLLNGQLSNDTTMPSKLLPDTYFVQDGEDYTAYIQRFPQKDVPSSAVSIDSIAPQFVCYYKSTTGISNFALPYSAVIDPPHLIQVDANNPNAFLPNPSRFRVYIDNVGGFGAVYREFPLEGVKVTLSLPDGMFEYNTAETDPLHPQNPNRTITKIVDRIEARNVGYVDFLVGTNQNAYGDLGYTVTIDPGSTVSSKVMNGTVTIASQPRLLIRGTEGGITGANLVSPPWNFQNTSWETILSGSGVAMRQDQDFRAFAWDAKLQAYIPSTGPQRSQGVWILSKKDLGYFSLGGSPTQPTDLKTHAPNPTLYPGWNLIGNPYNYSFPLAQIYGVSKASGDTTYSFQQLVDQGIISGSLAYWDQDSQTYKFIDVTQDVVPNRGYWLYVAAPQDVSLVFPPITQAYLRGLNAPSTQWVQSDKHWRLQLAARGLKSIDDQNYVGLVQTDKDVTRTRGVEPPTAPIDGAVTLSIKDTLNGKDASFASAYTAKQGKQEWAVSVFSKDAGTVTVTWPNLGTLPKNLQFRLVDVTTGQTRDMRRSSGYTFTTTDSDTTRQFKVQVQTGAASAAKIGSVTVTRGRGPAASAPLTIGYTLTSAATTTVRILGADGHEVYVPTRGRADAAGTNSVVWNLRDSANRAVPPGTYRVELVAETTDGERVRRIVPVTVTR